MSAMPSDPVASSSAASASSSSPPIVDSNATTATLLSSSLAFTSELIANLSTWQIALTLALAGLVLLALFLNHIRPKPLPGIPTPPYHWLFGHLFSVLPNTSRIHDMHAEYSLTFRGAGAYQMMMPAMEPVIVLTSPANLEVFFKTKFNSFEKGRLFQELFEELLGRGIFAVDGDEWREKRKTASHMFSEKVLRDDMHRVFVTHTRSVLDLIRSRSVAPKKLIDIQAVFFQFTLDAICEIAFGQNIDSLHNDDVAFARAFDAAQTIVPVRFLFPDFVWKFKRFFSIGNEGELKKHIRVINDFTMKLVHDRTKVKQDELRKYPDLVSRFLSEARDRGEELTEAYLRDVILNFMIAGRDTTACLLTWAVWELWQHPEEEKKLREELKRLKPADVKGDWIPSYRDAQEMVLLDAFLHETLRLHPSVPSDGKSSIEDVTFPDGNLFVPAGTRVSFVPYASCRQTSIWGRNAAVFDPSRWLGSKKPTQWEFPHFNAGPRTCLGQHVAILEAKVMFASLLCAFKWSVRDDHNPMYQLSVVLPMRDGLPTRFEPVDN